MMGGQVAAGGTPYRLSSASWMLSLMAKREQTEAQKRAREANLAKARAALVAKAIAEQADPPGNPPPATPANDDSKPPTYRAKASTPKVGAGKAGKPRAKKPAGTATAAPPPPAPVKDPPKSSSGGFFGGLMAGLRGE